jgi:hypothetical protein
MDGCAKVEDHVKSANNSDRHRSVLRLRLC